MTSAKDIVHIAPICLDAQTGMGRVAMHWREAFIRAGWGYRHYGINEIPIPLHKTLWGNSARSEYSKNSRKNDILLVHEPSAETFRRASTPTILFSHGLEVRSDELSPPENLNAFKSLKSTFTKPFWLRQAILREQSLRYCPLLLLISQDDRDYVISRYDRRSEDIFVFRNGVNPSSLFPQRGSKTPAKVLFYGSWIERKGKTVLIEAATKLASAGIKIQWLLVGVGKPVSEVLNDWPIELHKNVVVRSVVPADDDDKIYGEASLFVLPSFYEGQPLTLLQAMESGRCVITTRCCGQKDIINDGINGFLFEPGNSDQLAMLISKALSNDDMRFKTSVQAKVAMASRRWPQVADELVSRLDQFLIQKVPRD